MTIDFESLIQRQTVADIRAAVITAAGVVGWSVANLPPLARLRKLALDVVPVIVNIASAPNAEAIRGGLLDYASGVWLELLAINLFGLEGRIQETFATTAVTFTNAGPEPYSFAAGEVQVSNGVTVYRNILPFTLAASGSGATASIDVIASVAGTAGNAGAGDIVTMVTTFDGVTCTNPNAALGTDRELDPALRIRCRLARTAVSNSGPEGAIEFYALSAKRTDGTSIGVTRVQVVNNVPNLGDVATYLADADGGIASPDVDIIDAIIRTKVLMSSVNYLGTFAAVNVSIDITYTAYARSDNGFETADLLDGAEAAIVDLFSTYRIGGEVVSPPNGLLFRDDIRDAISDVTLAEDEDEDAPKLIRRVNVSLPSGDTTLVPGRTPILGTLTPTITRY